MLTQALDDLGDFASQPRLELRILGVDRTGHGKVLPDEDPLAVAQVIEEVVLVDVPAPAPDHVAAEVVDEVQDHGNPVDIARVIGVERHPVGAHCHHHHHQTPSRSR